MKYKICEFTGYEKECEISVFDDNNEYIETLYLNNIRTSITMDQFGFGSVKLKNVNCVKYDVDDNEIQYILSEKEITSIETEMAEYIDWIDFMDSQRPDDDEYEQRIFNSIE